MTSFWEESCEDVGSMGESFRRLAMPAGLDFEGEGRGVGAVKGGTAGFCDCECWELLVVWEG